MENGENEKIRKNDAAWNTDEQCFKQFHGMQVGGAVFKTPMGFNISNYTLPQGKTSGTRCKGRAQAPRAPGILPKGEQNPALSTKLFFKYA